MLWMKDLLCEAGEPVGGTDLDKVWGREHAKVRISEKKRGSEAGQCQNHRQGRVMLLHSYSVE